MARMTPAQWQAARDRWEHDPRDGYLWLVGELALPVSHVAVFKRARKEGWAKKVCLKSIVERAHRQADKVNLPVNEKSGPLTDAEAVDLRSEIIDTHRREWKDHRGLFPLSAMAVEGGLKLAQAAKSAADMLKVRQDGERRAWGLDALETETTSGNKTIEELDALFNMAMERAEKMRDDVRAEREKIGNAASG